MCHLLSYLTFYSRLGKIHLTCNPMEILLVEWDLLRGKIFFSKYSHRSLYMLNFTFIWQIQYIYTEFDSILLIGMLLGRFRANFSILFQKLYFSPHIYPIGTPTFLIYILFYSNGIYLINKSIHLRFHVLISENFQFFLPLPHVLQYQIL